MHHFQINILIFNFFMSSTCFEPKGSPSGRWLYIQVLYNVFQMQKYKQYSGQNSVFDTHTHTRTQTHTHTHTLSSTCYTAYTDASKTHYTIPVYMTILLKLNPWVRKIYKTSNFKNQNINLERVHFVGLYCTITLQCTVQNIHTQNCSKSSQHQRT